MDGTFFVSHVSSVCLTDPCYNSYLILHSLQSDDWHINITPSTSHDITIYTALRFQCKAVSIQMAKKQQIKEQPHTCTKWEKTCLKRMIRVYHAHQSTYDLVRPSIDNITTVDGHDDDDDDCIPTISLSSFLSRTTSTSAWHALFSPTHDWIHYRIYRQQQGLKCAKKPGSWYGCELHLLSSHVWLIIQLKPGARTMHMMTT